MNARPAAFDRAHQARRAMLAKVHIAKKELGLDDEVYRAVLQRASGRTSAGDCSAGELAEVLDAFKAKGWKPAVAGRAAAPRGVARQHPGARAADHPVAKKARALWISLWRLGVVRDRTDKALEAFARRQLKVERLQWADQGQGYKLIEALKAMAERAGWSQDLAGVEPERQVEVLKSRLEAAILARAEPGDG